MFIFFLRFVFHRQRHRPQCRSRFIVGGDGIFSIALPIASYLYMLLEKMHVFSCAYGLFIYMAVQGSMNAWYYFCSTESKK